MLAGTCGRRRPLSWCRHLLRAILAAERHGSRDAVETWIARIPEFRLADGATNSYLAQAGFIAAGLEGIAAKRSPGKRLDIDMYAEGHKVKAKKLPLYLIDALRNFEKSKFLKEALGAEFHAAFLKIKGQEWNDYSRHLTQWERLHTLDC